MGSLKSIGFTIALSIIVAVPAAAQYLGRGVYMAPNAPYAPKSYDECNQLDRAWQSIRNGVEREHTACLAEAQKRLCQTDPVTGCTCETCALYHDANKLGVNEVNACRVTVETYLQDERANRERERRQRELNARTEEQRRRDEIERNAERREAERVREAELREQRRRESDAIRSMIESSRSMRRSLERRTQLRDAEKDRLERERDAVDATYDNAVNRIVAAAGSLADEFKKVAEAPHGSGTAMPADPRNEFNLDNASAVLNPPPVENSPQLRDTLYAANQAFREWTRLEVRGGLTASARALIDDAIGDHSVTALAEEAYALQESPSERMNRIGDRAFDALFAPSAEVAKADLSAWVNESLRSPTDRYLKRPWAGDFGNAVVEAGVGMVVDAAMEGIREQLGVRVQQGLAYLTNRGPAPPEGTLERLEYDTISHADLPSLAAKTFPLTGPAAVKGVYDYSTTLLADVGQLLGFFVDQPGSQAAR
jgi:hypothetical protein